MKREKKEKLEAWHPGPPPAGPLCTAAPTMWHDEERGWYELPAGTPGVLVRDLAQEVSDPVERLALERRWQRDGREEPQALVWLEGRVRCLPCREVGRVADVMGETAA